MLVQFSVKNYRSFCDPVSLSLIAVPELDDGRDLEENTFDSGHHFRLCKSAAIYGANASGKSNLVKAITLVRNLVVESFTSLKASEKLPVTPFRLRTDMQNKPSEFALIWIDGHERFRYLMALDADRVHTESLYRSVAPKAKGDAVQEELLFKREHLAVEFGAGFPEGHDLPKGGFKRENALFLSYAAQFGGSVTTQVLKWFLVQLNPVSGLNDDQLNGYTTNQLARQHKVDAIHQLIRRADLSIKSIRIEKRALKREDLPASLSEEEAKKLTLAGAVKPVFVHQAFDESGNARSTVDFELKADQSQGTQKFFGLSGLLVEALDSGRILMIDEFDARLHPVLTRAIVELFHSPANKMNAQLVFVTHDSNLLDRHLLRRDQIWFTAKDPYGATDLYSLAEYKIESSANIENDYIQGRYGAIPYLRPLLDAEAVAKESQE